MLSFAACKSQSKQIMSVLDRLISKWLDENRDHKPPVANKNLTPDSDEYISWLLQVLMPEKTTITMRLKSFLSTRRKYHRQCTNRR